MSFILDALRKVEEERKREQQPGPESEVSIEGGREWAQPRSLMGVMVVAVGILALVAIGLGGYNLLRDRSAPPAASVSNVPAPVPLSPSLPAATIPVATPPVKSGEFPPSPSASVAAKSLREETTTPLETDPEPEEPEPVPPVRLVGREPRAAELPPVDPSARAQPPRAARSGSEDGESRSEGEAPRTEEETSIAREPSLEPQDTPKTADPSLAGLPALVLQGTATVEDRPVAIVNYQRVFEGDIIEGARVVKINDRSIELEFLGRRYTLRF